MQKVKGFTLLEVMVALAILSIALGAFVLAIIELNSNDNYLKEKTYANWVGMNIITEARLGLHSTSSGQKSKSGQVEMAKQNFNWHITFQETEDKNVDKIIADISNDHDSKLITLTGFIRKDLR